MWTKGGIFKSVPRVLKLLISSYQLGEMFEGDFTDTCVRKFSLVLKGGQADPSSVRRRGARTPIGTSLNLYMISKLITIAYRLVCLKNIASSIHIF